MDNDQSINLQTDRKIKTTRWIIFTRWFYPIGVLLIGFLTKNVGPSNVSFSYVSMVFLFCLYLILNFIFWLFVKKAAQKTSLVLLNLAGYGLLATELVFFTIIMHLAGGVESISNIFFFLPIVSASLIFGAQGSLITALFSGLMINFLIVIEYYGFIPHVFRYDQPTIEFSNLSVGLTKTLTNAIFFLIVGSFAGYGAKLLWRRETSFEEETERLNTQTKKLKGQENKLAAANAELDKKIEELATFQKLAVDRELRMLELKEKIRELTTKISK